MATKFSGGTYVNTTFTGDTKANIISNLQTQLTNAGWSVVSGGGTTNVLMQTAQDPTTNNQGRVRFKDNGGNCVQVTIENVSGSKAGTSGTATGQGASLLPAASKTFRILASKYRFEVFTPGASLGREFVCAGILWIPTPYQGVITEAIYCQGNAFSDTDTATRNSFRVVLGSAVTNSGYSSGIVNGSLLEGANSNQIGQVSLRVSSVGMTPAAGVSCYRWHDLAIDMCDPLMGWGLSAFTDECLIRGQVYDWTVIGDSFSADLTDTWTDGGSSHNWFALTNNNAGSNAGVVRGTIWVATS